MIKQNVLKLLEQLPQGVEVIAAAKTRTNQEISRAVEAGIKIIGENYIQEAQRAYRTLGRACQWHFIGHLQKNKAKKAVAIFDMIETVDSFALAEEIAKACVKENKLMPILIEINSGREEQKTGILPEEAEELIKKISKLNNLRVMGLMTMGPYSGDPEDARPCFTETKKVFNKIAALKIDNVTMRYLSMGMTNSYRVAIEEGANLVRIGTAIFGERQ